MAVVPAVEEPWEHAAAAAAAEEEEEEEEESVCPCAGFAVEDAHERVACITAPRSPSIVKGSTC